MRFKCKFFFLASLCLVLIKPCYTQGKKSFWLRFSLKLTAGFGSTLPIGDVNDCLKSFNDNEVFEAHREANTGLVVGEIKTLDTRIFHTEAELKFDLTRRISFGIATSLPLHKHNESSVTYTIGGWAGDQIMTWTFKPEIRVSPPVRLSAYYNLPIINRLNVSIGGGLGFYSAKITQSLRFDEITPSGGIFWSKWDQDAERRFSLGFHGNLVLQYSLTSRLALTAEFQTRWTKIGGLEGKLKHMNEQGEGVEKDGTLYYFTEWNFFIGTRIAALEMGPDIYYAPYRWIRDEREAKLDLSGYSVRMGINIRLS